ncbi:hypothetical protein [Xenorhabdus hominickii]|uniref:Uncharacterized protein n=1 Tax=Xenorhabdus hominickii TaxID=351679 RepID=A0A1V0M4M8_XENHO|nr:hypothetical protein [Xenorhabdus hominickii]ARD69836.1 hypothetical protein [Xenorhabdus hominickii]PHM51888.1 hypothetical protein Xhom_04727 [Xenorhabdus hominickii]
MVDNLAHPSAQNSINFCYAQSRTVDEFSPERVTINAQSWDEARRIIAPYYIATYAGHVPLWHDALKLTTERQSLI